MINFVNLEFNDKILKHKDISNLNDLTSVGHQIGGNQTEKSNKFLDFFYKHPKIFTLIKGVQYFTPYNRYMKQFIGKNPNVLEIGIRHGGSIEMWNYYFDNKCNIYGIDIEDKTEILNKFKKKWI